LKARQLIIAIGIIIILLVSSYFLLNEKRDTLIVYTADAYALESSYMLSNFSSIHGLAFTNPKTGGSFTLARQIAQGSQDDVFISVSKASVSQSYLAGMYSGWAIAFASDEMTIAYSNSSPAINKLMNLYQNAMQTNSNSSWAQFFYYLTSGSFRIGISDPNSDPAGLRAWLTLEAAGLAYADNETLYVDRMINSNSNVTAANAAELVAPLEAGQIQLLFIYRSAAISLGLNRFDLPGLINLGDPNLSSFYSELAWRTDTGLQRGAAILLFITVPKGSKNYMLAMDFVSYIINQNSALAKFGLQPLNPCIAFNSSDLPSQLQGFVSSGKIILGGSL